MLFNQVELIVSHIYKDKINNSFDITNLQGHFLTHALKKSFETGLNNVLTTSIKMNTYEKVKRELQTVDVYKHNIINNNHNRVSKPHYKITHRDSLFWSLYILDHGYLEYMKIHINYGNVYLNEKKKIYDNLFCKRDLVKSCNLRITNIKFQEIMSDLVSYSNKNIDYYMLYGFIAHYKFNIIILNKDKKSYFHFKNDMNGSTTHLIEIRKEKFFDISKEDIENTEIDSIYNTYVELHNFNTPMKGISSYKMDDLKMVARKLDITYDTLKKPDIYTKIYKTIAWEI